MIINKLISWRTINFPIGYKLLNYIYIYIIKIIFNLKKKNKSDLTNHKGYSKYKSAISKSIGSLIQMGNGFNGYYFTPTQGK